MNQEELLNELAWEGACNAREAAMAEKLEVKHAAAVETALVENAGAGMGPTRRVEGLVPPVLVF